MTTQYSRTSRPLHELPDADAIAELVNLLHAHQEDRDEMGHYGCTCGDALGTDQPGIPDYLEGTAARWRQHVAELIRSLV